MSELVLQVKNLETQFITGAGKVRAVEDVSFDLHKGEIIGVVGESGSGKSVTMLSLMQLVSEPGKIMGGEVYVGDSGENILEYPSNSQEMQNIRGGKIGMIFQEPMTSLNPVLTIGYQISEAILRHKSVTRDQARQEAIGLLKEVGIPDAESRYNYYPQQFSGGMRQRIMIAMALAPEPEVLIADEATTALDVTTQAQLLDLMQEISVTRGVSIIIVTHNMGVVARYADRVYVMYAGSIMESTDTKTIFANPMHPYTRGLLAAIPKLTDTKDVKLVPIDGFAPNPAKKPEYCPFYNRCLYHTDRCLEGKNELTEMEPKHFVRCCLSREEIEAKAEELKKNAGVRTLEKQKYDDIVLDVKGVSKRFPIYKGFLQLKVGEVKAVENLNFQVKKGETFGIVGESGCGKTTLARCLMRVYMPESGTIVVDGTDVTKLKKDRDLAPVRAKISMVFQDPFSSLDPRATAESIVAEPLLVHRLVNGKEEYDNRVNELFELVGLDPDMRARVPHEFSGGQRQRIGIARALASNPSIIIFDEPVSALDVSIQAQIINLLEDIQAKTGITYLFIAHDLAVVKHISDRIMVMYLGSIVEIAECQELYSNPLHPYTQALLSAIPSADPSTKSVERIRLLGEVPSVLSRPAGCPFSDRCLYASEECRASVPQLRTLENGHQVACFKVK